MAIGTKIKSLRREAGMTQEQLALRLSVTAQAVSRWENGTAMPDIMQLVPLARLFGVTTDALLDADDAWDQARTKELMTSDEYLHPESEDMIGDKIELFRKESRRHPASLHFKLALLIMLMVKMGKDGMHADAEQAREALKLCDEVIASGGNGAQRLFGSLRMKLLAALGEKEQLSEALKKAGMMRSSYEVYLPQTLEGEERKRARKVLLHTCLEIAMDTVYQMYEHDLTDAEREELQRAEGILAMVYGQSVHDHCVSIARLYQPLLAAAKANRLEEVRTRLTELRRILLARRDEEPVYPALMTENQQLEQDTLNKATQDALYDTNQLIDMIYEEFPQSVLEDEQVGATLDAMEDILDFSNQYMKKWKSVRERLEAFSARHNIQL